MVSILKCIGCGEEYPIDKVRYRCDCGDLLAIEHPLDELEGKVSRELFDGRVGSSEFPYSSGVWRYKELIAPIDNKFIVSRGEGNTNMYMSQKIAEYVGLEEIRLKHEGENPTGSFKDRGMTAGVSAARMLGKKKAACASTGNTSASLASYCSFAGMESVIFIPEGKIAYGKLAQALAYGAKTLQINGNFDDAMNLVQKAANRLGMYLLNSINPFRIEGQKAIGFEIMQQLGWEVPDWLIVPGGNLGNSSAIGKGLIELKKLGIIDKLPRIGVIQAHGANPLYRMWKNDTEYKAVENPDTLATAIKIGNPVSWKRSMNVIKESKGVVEEVSEQEIIDAKAIVDSAGIGAEPASCASVAGAKKLVTSGVIKPDENVVCILTGNLLKDPDIVVNYHLGKLEGLDARYMNSPIQISMDINEIESVLNQER